MNHQVQNYVLVDNEWVSRPVDVYQAMAHAQDSDSDMPEAPVESSTEVPEVGILSRTLFASPIFKIVRPATVRHKRFNDIVLIGEDAVQLKEIRDYGRLRHVATKTDFKGRILAAKVFGDPREVPQSVGSPLPKKQALHRGRRSIAGDKEHALPPEVIVLTLSTRTLMFLWARHTQTGSITFMQRTVGLPAATSTFDSFGAFLAIDPKRRAMAVSAQEGRFIMYKTKSMEAWRNELRAGRSTTPIEDERIIPVHGRIMHMDFLSSAAGQDDFHVVLLFIVVVQGRTKMICFDWDCREDLSRASVRTERFVVDLEDYSPSLLIPLSRTSEFLLIFDTHIAAYRDLLSGDPRRAVAPIHPPILPSLLPGDSKRRPRWVAWDRTPRNRDFPKEVFYIAREDGRVMYAESGPAHTLETSEAGDWPYRIDSAFACLSVDNSEYSQLYPDVLFAGGASNDGQLCKVGSWPAEYSYALKWPRMNQFSPIETIPNWTPLTDLLVSRTPGIRVPHERQRHSIFVSDGASPCGEISELRHGIQASVEHYFGGMNGCTGLWVVDHGCSVLDIESKTTRRHYATFAVTLPPETLLIRIVRSQHEVWHNFIRAWEDGTWDIEQIHVEDSDDIDGVTRDVETIAACPWSDTVAIQITRNEIRTLSRPTLRRIDSAPYNDSLLRAACKPGFPYVAVAFREDCQTHLETIQILPDGTVARDSSGNAGRKLRLEHDPTCIEILQVALTSYVFISTFDSKVGLLNVKEDGSLVHAVEDTLKNSVDEARVLLENAVLLGSDTTPVLVCATRGGHLLSSQLPLPGSNRLFDWRSTRMGTTSAQITLSSTDPSTAFVSCGPDFCLVRSSPSKPSVLDIKSIWFNDATQPDYMQSPVTAILQLPELSDADTVGRDLGGLLFTVAGDQLLFSQVETEAPPPDSKGFHEIRDGCRILPRKLITGSKPTYLTYLEARRKMVIATMQAKEERAPPHGYRILHSVIKLLNPADDKALEEVEIKQEDEVALTNKLLEAEFELKHGERVYSIAEWPFEDSRGKRHHLLILGTGVPGAGKETGRRLILNTGKQGSKLQLQKESIFDHPVYCTAVMDSHTSISAIGKTLTLDVFEAEAGLLKKRATVDLPSPAIHITIRTPYIYVSTLQHSHHCFFIKIDEISGQRRFQKVFEDSRKRSCSNHLIIDVNEDNPNTTALPANPTTIVLVTDKSSASLTGLYHPTLRTNRNAAPTLFEACLPRTVVRLQEGDIRPPWRRPIMPLTGVLKDDIIGACSDGTIYTFSILSEPARHLLRFIQNLITEKDSRDPSNRHTPINPRSGAIADVLMNGAEGDQEEVIRARAVDPRHQKGPRSKHVDGDLLGRWVDGDGNLERLVGDGTERGVGRLFEELVSKMWGQSGDEDGVLERVREWLEGVLMPLL